MAYDILQLIGKGVNIVYGGSKEEKSALAEQILNQYPEYRVEINKNYFPKKLGPLTFKVKKTVYQIIVEDARIKNIIDSKNLNYVSDQIEALECNHIVDRFPRRLSQAQRERTSVIIDGLNGKKCYLFNNSEYPSDVNYMMISAWLLSLDEFNKVDGRIIWIALTEEDRLLHELYKSFPDFASKCKFYHIEGGKLNYKENLYSIYSSTVAEENDGEKRKDITVEKPDNIVQIEKLIYECSVEPLGAIRMVTLMDLLREAGSVEHYEQLIEVIKMHLLSIEGNESNFYNNYNNVLVACEKAKAALLSGSAETEKSHDSSMSEKEYNDEQKHIISELYSATEASESISGYIALGNYIRVFKSEYADNELKLKACVKIAEIYEFGKGTARNIKEAQNWYEKAMDAGCLDPVVGYKALAMFTENEYEAQFQEEKKLMVSSEEYEDWDEEMIDSLASKIVAKSLYWNWQYNRISNLFEKYGKPLGIEDVEEYTSKTVDYWMGQFDIIESMQDEYSDEEIEKALNEYIEANLMGAVCFSMLKNLELIEKEQHENNNR